MKKFNEETQSILKKIEEGRKVGANIYLREYGNLIGPTCDHCGKTGIEFIAVQLVPKSEDRWEDESEYVIGMFGTTCIKTVGIKGDD